MKRGSKLLIRTCYILPLVLLLFGCAAPLKMQMPVQDFVQIDQNEGIVIGSVLMRGGKDILGRKGWRVEVYGMDPNLKNFSIDVERGGEEAVFVTKMLAGQYRFARLTQPGFSTFYADIDVPFTVHPAKTTYLGRLVIELSGTIHAGSEFLVRVEDVKEQTIASAEQTYGNLLRDAVTHLMGEEQYLAAIEIPQIFETVWYRPRKKDFSLRAYSHSGTLTIGKDAFQFACEGKQLTVPYASIVNVRWGTFGGDFVNEWAIITFSGKGAEEIAAFKDGKSLGHGPDSKKIYRTLKKACADYRGAEEK